MKNNTYTHTDDESHHLHDKTAKMVFKNKEAFVEFITIFIPHLAKKVDLDGLTLDNTNYLDSNFDEQFADVTYRTTYKHDAERRFELMFLIEHKRKIERSVALQLLGYIIEVLKTDFRENRPFTTIVVILLDQGKAKKRRKWQLIDYFDDLPKELKPYIPNFDIELVTIQGLPEDTILNLNKENILRGLFLIFKHLGDDEFIKENFPEFFTFVENNSHLFDYAKLYYEYLSRQTDMEPQAFRQLADDYFESQSKSNVMTTYDRIILLGKEEGVKQGLEQGLEQGTVKERKRNIRRALLHGWTLTEIANFMELSLEDIEALVLSMQKEEAEQAAADTIRAEAEVIENTDIDNSIAENGQDHNLTTEG
jgi:hypothetical protein